MIGVFYFLALALALAAAGPLDHSPFPREVNVIRAATRAGYRLPQTARPSKYNVKLIPYITEGNFTFDGEVLITFQAMEATTNITLHANRLTIDSAGILVTDVTFAETVEVLGIEEDPDLQFYSIMLATPLRSGLEYTILFKKFTGILDTDMLGFYRSSYVENGVRRWLATTQFESTEARRVFPCFDEPALRAQFTISISRTEDMRAISNMPQDGLPELDTEHTDEVRYWDHFLETPSMPTYLVAFIVSDFVFLENAAEKLRIYAQPQLITQARFALSVSPSILNWLAEYTVVPYQLPKMDQAAIPDFDAGAMENWGLATYREVYLLFEEGVSTTSSQQSIATIIAHEYAHQWFGNLVTLSWWRYIWLNEGFATYFESFGMHGVEPTWRLDEQFVVNDLQWALGQDATQDSHPMTYDVETPVEIEDLFDTISYSKSGAVIRMMEHMISSAIFRRGLRRYLVEKSYGAATADDLFNILNDQLHEDNVDADFDVKTVMDTWSLQMGYPVLTVTRDYAANSAELTQERFLLSFDPDHPDDHVYKWHIPLTYTTQGALNFDETSPKEWFNVEEATKPITGLPDETEWVLFNIKETGYYRVNYDAQNWALLTSHLNSDQYDDIHLLNRAQLVDDAFNLARAGVFSYDTPMALSLFLVREVDYVVWMASFNAFSFIDRKLSNSLDYPVFQSYLLTLTNNYYNSVGFEEGPDDGHIVKLSRSAAVRWTCNMGDQDCIAATSANFAEWMATPDNNPIKPDVKSTVYCTSLKYGGVTEWDFLYQKYLDNQVATESNLIISALGCSNDVDTLNAYMTLAITEGSSIRRQDSTAVFASVYNNPGGLDTALDFVIANFQEIATYYGSMNSVGNLMVNIANRSNRQDQADKMQLFLDINGADLGTAAANVERAISIVGDNIQWVATSGQEVIDWINNNTVKN